MDSDILQQLKNYLFRRRTAYVKTFLNPFGNEVLRDLAKFCRAHVTTFHSDPRAHALAEGRREVWLRIAQHLQLTEDELWRLYGNQNTVVRKPDA
jgi:hypothetical protein